MSWDVVMLPKSRLEEVYRWRPPESARSETISTCLSELLENPSTNIIDPENTMVDDDVVAILKIWLQLFVSGNIHTRTYLEVSDFFNCASDGDTMGETLSMFLCGNTTVTKLKVAFHTARSYGDKKVFEALQHNKCLEKLTLSSRSAYSTGSITILTEALNLNTTLKELDMSWGKFNKGDAEILIKGVAKNSSLTVLTLACVGMRISDTAALQRLLEEARSLLELDVSRNQIGNDGIVHIVDGILQNPHSVLKVLNVSFNACNAAGAEKLGDLFLMRASERQKSLTFTTTLLATQVFTDVLKVGCNGICADGAVALGRMLRLPRQRITELHLSYNEIGDEGTMEIAHGIKHSPHRSLSTFTLWECNIGFEGIAALIHVIEEASTQMKMLGLDGNDIGDEGAAILAQTIRDLEYSLEKLELSDVGIGYDGARLIRDALEHNCHTKVWWNGAMDATIREEVRFFTALNIAGRRLLRENNVPDSLGQPYWDSP